MSDTHDEDTNERISFEPDAPVDDTIQAAKERLREAPRFPDLPPDAGPDAILRAVVNLAFDLNERERHLLAVVAHQNETRRAIDERIARALERVNRRLDGIEASVDALRHTAGAR